VGCGRCGAPLDEGDVFCGDCGIFPRWAWPLAARCAHELADSAAAIKSLRELSTPYHLAHGLLDYAQYLAAASAARDARSAGSAAVARDTRSAGDAALAASAAAEARDIAGRLRCQPLLDRADALTPRDPVTATPQDSSRAVR